MSKVAVIVISVLLILALVIGAVIFITDPFGSREIKYSEIEFPENIGKYSLYQFNSNNWGEDCDQLPSGNISCFRTIRVEYKNSENNEVVHIIPRIAVTNDGEFKEAIKLSLKTSKENPNVYTSSDESDLMWFTEETFYMIGAQKYICS